MSKSLEGTAYKVDYYVRSSEILRNEVFCIENQ